MGIIDKTTYTLICPKCGTSESSSVLDKGSTWGDSCWGSNALFSQFQTSWTGGGAQEPRITTAICKKCGTSAKVQSGE